MVFIIIEESTDTQGYCFGCIHNQGSTCSNPTIACNKEIK